MFTVADPKLSWQDLWAIPIARQALEQALQGLSEQEQIQLKNLLNRIGDNLD